MMRSLLEEPREDHVPVKFGNGTSRDRCDTATHGRYLPASNDPPPRLLSARAFNQSRPTREGRPPSLPGPSAPATGPG
jgi:hypothetical protein